MTLEPLRHPFETLPTVWRWACAFALLALGVGVLVWVVRVVPGHVIFASPLTFPLLNFTLTPLMRQLGVWQYYSAMLMAEQPTAGRIVLHSGTSFDWWACLRFADRGRVARRQVLLSFVEGLIELTDRVDRGEIPATVEISATSWFLDSERMSQLGFTFVKPTLAAQVWIWANALELFVLYSFSQGRPALPRLRTIKTAVTTARSLAENRSALQDLYNGLATLDSCSE